MTIQSSDAIVTDTTPSRKIDQQHCLSTREAKTRSLSAMNTPRTCMRSPARQSDGIYCEILRASSSTSAGSASVKKRWRRFFGFVQARDRSRTSSSCSPFPVAMTISRLRNHSRRQIAHIDCHRFNDELAMRAGGIRSLSTASGGGYRRCRRSKPIVNHARNVVVDVPGRRRLVNHSFVKAMAPR